MGFSVEGDRIFCLCEEEKEGNGKCAHPERFPKVPETVLQAEDHFQVEWELSFHNRYEEGGHKRLQGVKGGGRDPLSTALKDGKGRMLMPATWGACVEHADFSLPPKRSF